MTFDHFRTKSRTEIVSEIMSWKDWNKQRQDEKATLGYINYQVKHGVHLDDVLRNLGYIKIK